MAYTTIDKPSDYFETVTYAGGTTDISSLDFQPDWVWGKKRDGAENHALFDSVRGATKTLNSNTSAVESTRGGSLTSFDSDGFTMGGSDGIISNSGSIYVAWNWVAGTSFTNDASSTGIGSLDSSGTVNDTAGFAIVKYTGNGTSGATIKHGLSTAPTFMMIRVYDAAAGFQIYSKSLGATKFVYLNTTEAAGTSAGAWNDTAPTSSIFTVGNGGNTNNTENAGLHIAYIFSERQGYSKFGSYTGNGNADGPFVYTGFKPAWTLIKRTDSATGGSWILFDNKRGANVINPVDVVMAASNNQAESDWGTTYDCDYLSNGFKWRYNGTGGYNNADGGTYIYMAFAENPFVTSTGVPATAR